MPAFTIPTIYTAVDKFSPALRAMERANASFGSRLDTVSAKSERLFRKLTPGISDATKQMLSFASSAAIVGAAIGTAGFSVKAIMDYETSIQSLQAVTGTTAANMPELKRQVNELATESRKSSIDVAKSFETIGSAMSQYLDDPKALRMVADAGITLSKASRMELQPTLEALTSVMNQFSLGAEKANDTINRLTAGEIVGSVSTAKIAEHLQQFGAVASANNVTLSESVALVETLGKKLPAEQLGTASRNLITFLSAAKGMPKEARAGLIKHGVSLDVLMDKNKSLGERLKELSKIQGDSVAMVKFFGRENVAAGTTIFQNLGLYNEWAGKIQTTNKAQEQAALNSNTLSNKLAELKNRFINMLTSSDATGKGLDKLKKIIGFVTDHLDTIIDVGLNVLKFFALWKAANIAMKVSLIATRAVSNAFFLVDMIKYTAATRGITTATAAWEIAQASLNTTMAANPIGLIIVAVGALAYAIYNLYKNWDTVSTLFSTSIAGIKRDFMGAALQIEDSFMSMIDNIRLGWSALQMSFGAISAKEHMTNAAKIKHEQVTRTKAIMQNSAASKAADVAEGKQIFNAVINDSKKNDSDFANSKMAKLESSLNSRNILSQKKESVAPVDFLSDNLTNPNASGNNENNNATEMKGKIEVDFKNVPQGAEVKTDSKFISVNTSSTMLRSSK